MKTNIKMRVTPEQSRRVQEICFKNNIAWHEVKAFDHLRQPYIYVYENTLGYDCKESSEYFNDHENIEIDADLFIRTNGTCEEVFRDKADSYFKQADDYYKKVEDSISNLIIVELQNKLKKKNEILKKARIKRKNQREELHKLNLKLQKCISLEEHNKKIESIEFDLNMFKSSNKLRGDLIEKLESENIEMGKLVNLNKSALDLAVITKELAMNEIERKNKEIEKLKAVIEYLESKVK